LTAHTGGAHIEDARNSINDALDWKNAQATGTIDAYEAYLKAHTGGAHVEEARNGVESLDWDKTAVKGMTATSAYLDFHHKYPDSTRLTAVTADVDCSQIIQVHMNYGVSGEAYLESLNVTVTGHPELSGEYRPSEAGACSLIQCYTEQDGIISKLHNAHLLVANVKGKTRIVAVDTH
jgi:hypothetical protein